jgi:hypothetical protein
MRLGLNILATFLHSLKPRKLTLGPRNTYLPTIFARHNPRLAARAARLRASKSASRISFRTTAAAPSFTSTGTGTGTQHRRRRHARSLRRSTAAVLPAQVPSYPQPPGAFACAAPGSTNAPNAFNVLNGDSSTPLVAQKVFFDELYKQRAVLMRATEERQRRAEEDAEYLRLLSEDQRKAQEALRRAEAEEVQRRAEEERLEEERRLHEDIEAKERRRRRKREAEERRRRRAAREERREQARLEQERLEQERREQERLEQERREREQEALRRSVAEWHRCYDEKWVVLRGDVHVRPLAFSDIPWPLFGIPTNAEDITLVRVQEFLCHPQREAVLSAGLVKSLRSEMLRWHPDKFNAKVLNKIMEGDREAVVEAAGKVARFLTQLTAEMKGR